MTIYMYLFVFISILFISFGQILFKYVSILSNNDSPIYKIILYIAFSFFISGFGTLIWMYILKFIELNKVYPFMALTFIFVPLISCYMYNEKLNIQYLIGLSFIIIGIIIIAKNNSLGN